MVGERSRKRLPPYVSYRTFRHFVEELEQGMPARIDRSYWGDRLSGSTGAQAVSALQFLGLVDSVGIPTSRLKQLVSAKGAQRAEVLKDVSREKFAFLLQSSFDPATATYAQLEEAFRDEYQVTGDVARKCTKFFISLAQDAGVPVSSFIIKKSGTARSGAGTKRIIKKFPTRTNRNGLVPQSTEEVPGHMSLDKMLLAKFPAFDPNWPDEVKMKWFQAFDELLKRYSAKGP